MLWALYGKLVMRGSDIIWGLWWEGQGWAICGACGRGTMVFYFLFPEFCSNLIFLVPVTFVGAPGNWNWVHLWAKLCWFSLLCVLRPRHPQVAGSSSLCSDSFTLCMFISCCMILYLDWENCLDVTVTEKQLSVYQDETKERLRILRTPGGENKS